MRVEVRVDSSQSKNDRMGKIERQIMVKVRPEKNIPSQKLFRPVSKKIKTVLGSGRKEESANLSWRAGNQLPFCFRTSISYWLIRDFVRDWHASKSQFDAKICNPRANTGRNRGTNKSDTRSSNLTS